MARTDLELCGTSNASYVAVLAVLCRISQFLHRSIAAVLHTKYRFQSICSKLYEMR